jgi:hypothetical protein
MADLNATTIEAAMRIIEGTARNMGIKVEQLQHFIRCNQKSKTTIS